MESRLKPGENDPILLFEKQEIVTCHLDAYDELLGGPSNSSSSQNTDNFIMGVEKKLTCTNESDKNPEAEELSLQNGMKLTGKMTRRGNHYASDESSQNEHDEMEELRVKTFSKEIPLSVEETWDFSLRKFENGGKHTGNRRSLWVEGSFYQKLKGECLHEMQQVSCGCEEKNKVPVCRICHEVFCSAKCFKRKMYELKCMSSSDKDSSDDIPEKSESLEGKQKDSKSGVTPTPVSVISVEKQPPPRSWEVHPTLVKTNKEEISSSNKKQLLVPKNPLQNPQNITLPSNRTDNKKTTKFNVQIEPPFHDSKKMNTNILPPKFNGQGLLPIPNGLLPLPKAPSHHRSKGLQAHTSLLGSPPMTETGYFMNSTNSTLTKHNVKQFPYHERAHYFPVKENLLVDFNVASSSVKNHMTPMHTQYQTSNNYQGRLPFHPIKNDVDAKPKNFGNPRLYHGSSKPQQNITKEKIESKGGTRNRDNSIVNNHQHHKSFKPLHAYPVPRMNSVFEMKKNEAPSHNTPYAVKGESSYPKDSLYKNGSNMGAATEWKGGPRGSLQIKGSERSTSANISQNISAYPPSYQKPSSRKKGSTSADAALNQDSASLLVSKISSMSLSNGAKKSNMKSLPIELDPDVPAGILLPVKHVSGNCFNDFSVMTSNNLELLEIIGKGLNEASKLQMDAMEPGSFCMVKYGKRTGVSEWCRGLITQIKQGQCIIFLLDYVVTISCHLNEIKQLPEKFKAYRPLAIRMRAMNIIFDLDDDEAEASQHFDELVRGQPLKIKITHKVKSNEGKFAGDLEIMYMNKWYDVGEHLQKFLIGRKTSGDEIKREEAEGQITFLKQFSFKSNAEELISNEIRREILITLTHVESLTEFYIATRQSLQRKLKVESELNERDLDFNTHSWSKTLEELSSNQIIFFDEESDMWVRIAVLEVVKMGTESVSVVILKLDKGEKQCVLISSLRFLSESTDRAMPSTVYRCSLPVKSSMVRRPQMEEAVDILKSKLQHKMKAVVLSKEKQADGTMLVELFFEESETGCASNFKEKGWIQLCYNYDLSRPINK